MMMESEDMDILQEFLHGDLEEDRIILNLLWILEMAHPQKE